MPQAETFTLQFLDFHQIWGADRRIGAWWSGALGKAAWNADVKAMRSRVLETRTFHDT
jgi:hypothetical protein